MIVWKKVTVYLILAAILFLIREVKGFEWAVIFGLSIAIGDIFFIETIKTEKK